MKIPQLTRLVSGQASVDNTANGTTIFTTDWILAAGGVTLTTMQELRRLAGAGTFTSLTRYRFASASTLRPEAWVNSANERSAAGIYGEDFTISGTTNMMWLQLALAGRGASGVAEAFCRLQGAVAGTGVLLATQTLQIVPTPTGQQATYYSLGNPFPQTGLTKLMYGIVWSGVSGTIAQRPAWRQISGNIERPDDWVDIGSSTNVSADADTNSGQVTSTPTGGNLLAQAGLKISGDARGTAKVVVAGIFG